MIVTPKEFDFKAFAQIKRQKRKKGNQGKRKLANYKDILTAFDIETTRIPAIEQSIMYVWQWHFHIPINQTVIGRTWAEFEEFADMICDICEEQDMELVVWDHNLSYEFQFLRNVWEWNNEDVFAVDSRKVLKATHRTLEYRCSYLHSNMNLKTYLNKMGAEHKKLDGAEYNYDKPRYPWTPLTDKELEYCCNDVIGLCEALEIEMAIDGDNLYSVPLTSTGYVRRDCKRAMRAERHGLVSGMLPNLELYEILREAFRGGNTHANRFYSGHILHDVHSADMSSSYPSAQCNCPFPMSEFYHAGPQAVEDVEKLMNVRHRALVMRVCFSGLRLRNRNWPCPYLSHSKCRDVIGEVLDNGRILSADYLETTITDIDYRIILEEYVWDEIAYIDVWHARYGKLPVALTDCTKEYFTRKTNLKDVKGQEIIYSKTKALLNAIYGMSAQDPGKIGWAINGVESYFENDTSKSLEQIIEDNNRRAFQPYQWGVWIAAWSRYRLEEGIKLVGADFIYCDTDSVKYLGEHDWSALNTEREKQSIESGAFATDPSGHTHYMGVYEDEGIYKEFVTLGAKKYVYRNEKGRLCATISGVPKDEYAKDGTLIRMGGGAELEKAGGIEAFRPGFTFVEAGKMESVYNDEVYGDYVIDNHQIHIGPNCVIRPTTYKVGLAGDYAKLLKIENDDENFLEFL